MNTPFRDVYFDITGTCNASCPYCVTGSDKNRMPLFVSRERFSTVLTALVEQRLVDSRSVIGLYNWGEPFLNSDLDGIVEVINRLGLSYSLSTNGSIVHKIDSGFVRNLRHLLFSMPGFSQVSYDRISKLDFEHVKRNISKLTHDCLEAGFKGDVAIVYHVYQFNIDEMFQCEEFGKELGVRFSPCYAILNDWTLLRGWLAGTLPLETVRTISEDLFCFNIRKLMAESPAGYICPQWSYLVLNDNADVLTCCQVPPHGSDYCCGNVLHGNISEILEQKQNMPVCAGCLRSGLAYYLNNSLIKPSWYDSCFKNSHVVKCASLLSRVFSRLLVRGK